MTPDTITPAARAELAARIAAARSQIAAEERAERVAATQARREALRAKALREAAALEATLPLLRGRARTVTRVCARAKCRRRFETRRAGQIYCGRLCQHAEGARRYIAKARARTEARPLVRLVCECGCGVEFETRSTVKRFASDRCQRRAHDVRRYWLDARRRDPRGCNRMMRVGGAA